MSVKIRLTRIGRHADPHYRIVAADSRNARDGRVIEQIGYYNPNTELKDAVIDRALALKWLAAGAQPSDTVRSLFVKAGIIAEFTAIKKEGK